MHNRRIDLYPGHVNTIAERSLMHQYRAMGRPSSFKAEYVEQARHLCRLGATDEEMAEFFDTSTVTIYAWKKAHPTFLKATKEGKVEADRRVTEGLYRRACGAVLLVQKDVKLKKVWWEDGHKCEEEEVKVVDLKVEVPPDTAACFIWLKNRRQEQWRDKIVHSSDPENPIGVTFYLPDNSRDKVIDSIPVKPNTQITKTKG